MRVTVSMLWFCLITAGMVAGAGVAPAHSQVNTESLRTATPDGGVHGTAEVYFSNRTGNTDLTTGGGTVRVGWRGTDRSVLFVTETHVGKARQTTTINRGFSHLRGTWAVHPERPRLRWELFVQHGFDRFARLSGRTLLGSGPRIEIWRGAQGSVHWGVASMLEWERLDVRPGAADDPDVRIHRLSTYVAASYQPKPGVTLSETIYVQPRPDQGDDLRVLEELTAHFSLGGGFGIKSGLSIRYDGNPPTGVKPLDTSFSNRLVWDF